MECTGGSDEHLDDGKMLDRRWSALVGLSRVPMMMGRCSTDDGVHFIVCPDLPMMMGRCWTDDGVHSIVCEMMMGSCWTDRWSALHGSVS